MKKKTLQIVTWKEGKHYVAQCLNVEVSSFGSTKNRAIKNITEALELYFEGTKSPNIVEVKSPSLSTTSLVYA